MLAQKRLQRDLENLQNDLKVLINDANDLGVQELQATEQAFAEKSVEQIRQIAQQAQQSLSQLRQQLRQTGQKVEATVEKHPYAALSAAMGLGFVLGKLGTMRKSSSP
ncbi:MAG: hypothetical protein ACKOA8_00225 [Deltaproteobacteria bacterium]